MRSDSHLVSPQFSFPWGTTHLPLSECIWQYLLTQSGPGTQDLLKSVYLAIMIVSGVKNDSWLASKPQLWDFDMGCTSKTVFLVDVYIIN